MEGETKTLLGGSRGHVSPMSEAIRIPGTVCWMSWKPVEEQSLGAPNYHGSDQTLKWQMPGNTRNRKAAGGSGARARVDGQTSMGVR